MQELEFFMDVSPNWWLRARDDETFLKKYVIEKFQRDYYPRIITQNRKKIDLDETKNPIKGIILQDIKLGNFQYEFLPEDENLKESYLIKNGKIHFNPRRKKINSRLLLRLKL